MKRYMSLIGPTFSHWRIKNAMRMGAALSYYATFAVAPILILVISIGGIVFSRGEITSNIIYHLSQTFGDKTTDYIISVVQAIGEKDLSVWGAIIGAGVLLFTAISAISELDNDIEELWGAPRAARTMTFANGVKKYFRTKLMLVPMIIVITLLTILSVSFGIIFSRFPGGEFLQHATTFLLAVILLLIVYRVLPSVKLPWGELLRGASITALFLLLGKILIGDYLQYADVVSGFGGAGSLAAILAWIYYSSQVFFLCASYMYVYSKKYGYLSKK